MYGWTLWRWACRASDCFGSGEKDPAKDGKIAARGVRGGGRGRGGERGREGEGRGGKAKYRNAIEGPAGDPSLALKLAWERTLAVAVLAAKLRVESIEGSGVREEIRVAT